MMDYIKNIVFRKKTILLMLAGIAATILSFVYPETSAHTNEGIIFAITFVDIFWLLVNAHTVSSMLTSEKENAKRLDTINAFLIAVMYFCAFLMIAYTIFETDIAFEQIMETLSLAVKLGPCLLIVLPILFLIFCIIGG
jgi:hypothetical protein